MSRPLFQERPPKFDRCKGMRADEQEEHGYVLISGTINMYMHDADAEHQLRLNTIE